MTLLLRIENFDQLPDGGPTELAVDRRLVEIGRAEGLDWTLPDPARVISGKHCEIRYENDAYVLYDISTNGTRVNGQSDRVKSPYRIHDGDRIMVGDYIINASLDADHVVDDGSVPSAFDVGGGDSSDVWGFAGPTPAPVDRKSFRDRNRTGRRDADFSQERIDLPAFDAPAPPAPAAPPAAPPARVPHGESASPFGPGPEADAPPSAGENIAESGASPFAETPPEEDAPVAPRPRPMPSVGRAVPEGDAPEDESGAPDAFGRATPIRSLQAPRPAPLPSGPPEAESAPSPRSTPTPPARPASAPVERRAQNRAAEAAPPSPRPSGAGDGALLGAIAEAAGMAPDAFDGVDPRYAAQTIGETLHIVAEDLAKLLRTRSTAKRMTRNRDRTMLGRENNNALKFVPTAGEALEIMFAGRSPGYMDAPETMRSSFRDLQSHEVATYAAMQKALSRLMDDLDPDTIEGRVKVGAMGNKRARAWDAYRERWDAYTEPNENGILDVFLAYFADAYDTAGKGE